MFTTWQPLERLVALARAEFPDDETMARSTCSAILAVERDDASLDEILRQEVAG